MTHKPGHEQKPRSSGQQGIGRTQRRNQQKNTPKEKTRLAAKHQK